PGAATPSVVPRSDSDPGHPARAGEALGSGSVVPPGRESGVGELGRGLGAVAVPRPGADVAATAGPGVESCQPPRPGTKAKREKLNDVIAYPSARVKLRDYGRWKAADLVIASGVVEGAARYVVGERLDQSARSSHYVRKSLRVTRLRLMTFCAL